MQGSVRQAFVELHSKNERMRVQLKQNEQKAMYLVTKFNDAKYTIKQQAEMLDKVTKELNELKSKSFSEKLKDLLQF